MEKIKAQLIGPTVSSNSKPAQDLFAAQRFGEKVGEKIHYSLSETLFLIETKKLDLYDYRNKKIAAKKITERFHKLDKKFKIKFTVFKNLRSRGYILKTALKFGAEFRVYEPGTKIGEKHAKWILFPISEVESLTWHEFSAKNRVAHSTKKNLLIAIVDEEDDVSYYEIKWIKP
jgi:tRNA-intron endonuclease, archaea type